MQTQVVNQACKEYNSGARSATKPSRPPTKAQTEDETWVPWARLVPHRIYNVKCLYNLA